MKATITILDVQMVKGFIHQNSIYAGDPNQYRAKSSPTYIEYDPKALLIKAIIENEEVSFYTPTVIITHTRGMLNYSDVKANSWITIVEEKGVENKDAFGQSYFETPCTIKPCIKPGDVLNISYTKGDKRINRVKII